MEYEQPIGLTIWALRKNMGLTVDRLAHELGVNPATVYDWENAGVRSGWCAVPNARNMEKLRKFFGDDFTSVEADVITTEEVAKILDVSKNTIKRWVQAGEIEITYRGYGVYTKGWWFDRQYIEKFAEEFKSWQAPEEDQASMLDIDDVAEMLDVGRTTVKRWIKSGKLEAHKVFGNGRGSIKYAFYKEDVEKFAAKRKAQPRAVPTFNESDIVEVIL
jgi:excisionase family DNA binding protein